MSLAWFLPLPGSYAGVDAVGVYNFACSLREVLAKHPFLPQGCGLVSGSHFPSFSEGLSLRRAPRPGSRRNRPGFPFLFGRAFIEAIGTRARLHFSTEFPFLFGRAFIEAEGCPGAGHELGYFPSFSEGLSLRHEVPHPLQGVGHLSISLPFRKGFH